MQHINDQNHVTVKSILLHNQFYFLYLTHLAGNTNVDFLQLKVLNDGL